MATGIETAQDNVNLSAALDSTPSAKKEEKKRKRSRGLPQPPLPEGKRQYTDAILDINPETHSLPPERTFGDPLHYWQSREAYADNVKSFARKKCEELGNQTLDQRLESRRAEARQRAVQSAVNNDAVKEALAANPELLVQGMSQEAVANLVAQLNAMMAQQNVE